MKEFWKTAKGHYTIAFFTTLVLSIGLIILGVLTPPVGEIDGSLITTIGVVFLWPALAFANKALEEGKTVKITKEDMVVQVGDIPDNNDEMTREYDAV